MKRKFTFQVMYFKPSGKWYSTAEFDLEVTALEHSGTAYMDDVVQHLKKMRDRTIEGPMPGLTGLWWGPMVVNCEQGFPVLIPGLQAEED